MDLRKVNVKVMAAQGADAPLRDAIPVFHKIIQEQMLPDLLLIDVTEYTHLLQGPGVLLIAHEANLGLDEQDGRRGMLAAMKRSTHNDPLEQALHALSLALRVSSILEKETKGKFVFDAGDLEVCVNNRLVAPNDGAHRAELEADLRSVLGIAYPGAAFAFKPETDPLKRCGFSLKSTAPISVGDALARTTKNA